MSCCNTSLVGKTLLISNTDYGTCSDRFAQQTKQSFSFLHFFFLIDFSIIFSDLLNFWGFYNMKFSAGRDFSFRSFFSNLLNFWGFYNMKFSAEGDFSEMSEIRKKKTRVILEARKVREIYEIDENDEKYEYSASIWNIPKQYNNSLPNTIKNVLAQMAFQKLWNFVPVCRNYVKFFISPKKETAAYIQALAFSALFCNCSFLAEIRIVCFLKFKFWLSCASRLSLYIIIVLIIFELCDNGLIVYYVTIEEITQW